VESIVLLGAPGSGKGTQTERICADFGYFRVSTGDIIRSEIRLGTDLGMKTKEFQEKGLLVPDDVVCDMVFNAVEAETSSIGVVFDGFPRTLFQADRLSSFLEQKKYKASLVFYFEVQFEEIARRILSRLSCPGCGAVYSAFVHGINVGEACPKCGQTVGIRSDDSLDVLKSRFDIFCRELDPILSYYGDRVIRVDATQTPDALFSFILGIVSKERSRV